MNLDSEKCNRSAEKQKSMRGRHAHHVEQQRGSNGIESGRKDCVKNNLYSTFLAPSRKLKWALNAALDPRIGTTRCGRSRFGRRRKGLLGQFGPSAFHE